MNEKILVTGASGQLGRRLVRVLHERGYMVKAHFRNNERADKYCPPTVERVIGDIVEPAWLDGAVRGCTYVIHCAARVSVRPMKDPDYIYKVNVEGTRAVVEACLRNRVKRLVHLSSVAAVGASTDGRPLTEDAEFNLGGYGIPYFETKREAENIALAANSDTLQVIVLNPSIMFSLPDREFTHKDIRKIPRRLPAYFDFGINVVETSDVIEAIIKALHEGRPGQRYILAGDDLDPQRAFHLAHRYFGIKKPLLKIPRWLIYLIGGLAEIIYIFKDKKPRLNRNIARLLKLKFYYSSDKAKRELGYCPKALEKSLEQIASAIVAAKRRLIVQARGQGKP